MFEFPIIISELALCLDLIKMMVKVNPKERICGIEALEHCFFNNDENDDNVFIKLPGYTNGNLSINIF
jgi:hypothetical protein